MSWETVYQAKLTDAATAVSHIQSGQRVYIGGGAGVPRTLTDALGARQDDLRDVELTHILTFADAPYAKPGREAMFRVNA
ncbi:MAG: hypothetical protein KDE34_21620, partial [Anaerolineales bacterium]|nr:hypothetical protein [Anaerolineales bacterium]